MKNLRIRVQEKTGAVTIEYVLVLGIVVLGLIGALTIFAGILTRTIIGQSGAEEKTFNDNWCQRMPGMTKWDGGYGEHYIPTCK